MKRVAICHWGLTRTLEITYETHKKHLYDLLEKNNIEYDKYLHTWNHLTNTITDFNKFNFKNFIIEDQTDVINDIEKNFSDYWYEHIYKQMHGDSYYEWLPNMVKNHLYGMNSVKRVTQMCIDSGIKYDYIIYMRPDCILFSDVPCDFINIDDNSIVVPREHWGSKNMFGINEVITIVPFNKCKNFGFRIDETKYYRKNIGRLAGEHYLGWIVQKYFTNIIYSDVKFYINKL
jgi:hypothetical protein